MEKTPLPFLHEIGRLKDVPRTGWLRTIENPESVSDHIFRVAILAYLAPASLNLDEAKCIKMALFHDLGEAVIGDIPTFAAVPKDDKYKMELNGFKYLATRLQGYSPEKAAEIQSLWQEYESGESPEAQWVRQMDKFECLLQAHEYEQRTCGEKDLSEFQGQSSKIVSPEATDWLKALQAERGDHLSRRTKRLPIVFFTGNPLASQNVSEQVSRTSDLPCISVEKILSGAAKDPNAPWSEFIRSCRERGLDIPVMLIVQLLEDEIRKVPAESAWILISGFPRTVEQIEEFERKVQKSNNTIWLAYASDPPHHELPFVGDSGIRSWKPVVDLKKYLKKSTSNFCELTGTDEQLEKLSKGLLDTLPSILLSNTV